MPSLRLNSRENQAKAGASCSAPNDLVLAIPPITQISDTHLLTEHTPHMCVAHAASQAHLPPAIDALVMNGTSRYISKDDGGIYDCCKINQSNSYAMPPAPPLTDLSAEAGVLLRHSFVSNAQELTEKLEALVGDAALRRKVQEAGWRVAKRHSLK